LALATTCNRLHLSNNLKFDKMVRDTDSALKMGQFTGACLNPRRDHHMSNTSAQPDPLERACSLVGRFMFHFGRVEKKIDQAVIKLSDLDEKVAPIVAMTDFARKVDFVRTSAYAQTSDAKNKKDFAKETCNTVHGINLVRRMIAHTSFESTSNGDVQFGRTVTKDGCFQPVDPPWTDTDFSECYVEMIALETELDKLIELIKPVPFGWLASFHETYHRSNSALRTGALASSVVEVPGPPPSNDPSLYLKWEPLAENDAP
jgi:hypothetical protein